MINALAWCLVKIPYELFSFLVCFTSDFRSLSVILNSKFFLFEKLREVLIFPFYAVLYRHT